MKVLQHTIRNSIQFRGVGLHSGRESSLTLRPAAPGVGRLFRFTGSESSLPATHDSVASGNLCTALSNGKHRIMTTEHLMAALYGLGVDNVIVDVDDGAEVPILDGSSRQFVDKILEAGIICQDIPGYCIDIIRPIQVIQDQSSAYLLPLGRDAPPELSITVDVDFQRNDLPRKWFNMCLNFSHPGSGHSNGGVGPCFINEVSGARTFTFKHEVDLMRSRGLALGGSLENAVVFEGGKPLNPEGLRFEDEWARHKALDVVGDLALAGAPIRGIYVGLKPGHALNHALLSELFSDTRNWRRSDDF